MWSELFPNSREDRQQLSKRQRKGIRCAQLDRCGYIGWDFHDLFRDEVHHLTFGML